MLHGRITFQVILWVASIVCTQPAASIECEALEPVGGAAGYAMRAGDPRCEGLYQSPVRGGSLDLVSLLHGQLSFEHGTHRTLFISAPVMPSDLPSTLQLRAVAVPLKTYYRMDALLEAGSTMRWPIHEVLARTGLDREHVGVYAWVRDGRGQIFVPLTVLTTHDANHVANKRQPVRLILRASVDLESVLWRSSSSPSPSGWQKAAADRLRYGKPVIIELPPGTKGIERIEIRGKPMNSDNWLRRSIRIWLPPS